jgi:UDP-N-acetylglucosamine diphosphorylase/glucosamine-1-phosphate N-acetyltransferase
MPISDTNFIEAMRAKQKEQLAKLMEGMEKKEEVIQERIAVVILAAGLGKRMKNPERPKVMFELNGKPMIQYVVELAFSINAERIIPIVGHRREQLMEFLTNLLPNKPVPTEGGSGELPEGSEETSNAVIDFAVQEPQLGTGHAVMQTENLLKDFEGEVLILSGDVPLLRYETAERLIDEHFKNKHYATLLTAIFKDPAGYGRIVRDSNGRFEKIVEHRDATEEEKKIHEMNPAIYIVNRKVLFDSLKKITPENDQKEYYLTDIFSFIPKEKIGTVVTEDETEVTGINSVEQLEAMEKLLRSR